MNRWMNKIITLASITTALSLGAGSVAFAQAPDGAPSQGGHGHHARGHEGMLGRALKLDSLTPQQRSAIEALKQTRRTAEVPVRQADARVLTALATQVEQASLDRQALAPTVQARDAVATTARGVEQDTLQKLHDLLTPAQRGQLVDALEADFHAHGRGGVDGGPRVPGEAFGRMTHRLGLTADQQQQIATNLRAERQANGDAAHPDWRAQGKAWLDSFRTDAFNASAASANAPGAIDRRTAHMEDVVQAALPVLTPAQRSQLANQFRTRAAHS